MNGSAGFCNRRSFNVGQASRLPSAAGAFPFGRSVAGAGETPALLSPPDLNGSNAEVARTLLGQNH